MLPITVQNQPMVVSATLIPDLLTSYNVPSLAHLPLQTYKPRLTTELRLSHLLHLLMGLSLIFIFKFIVFHKHLSLLPIILLINPQPLYVV
jgi:hypothetical protein